MQITLRKFSNNVTFRSFIFFFLIVYSNEIIYFSKNIYELTNDLFFYTCTPHVTAHGAYKLLQVLTLTCQIIILDITTIYVCDLFL